MLKSNSSDIKTEIKNIQAEVDLNTKSKKFKFIRHKSLGRLDISHIISDVTISDSTLNLKQQKIALYFFKKMPIETVHNIMDITSIKIVRVFDISDTIFSVIFALLGFFQPICFILSILLFWVALGKKIEIKKINNSTISIPTGNSSQCSELMQTLISINKSIVVKL